MELYGIPYTVHHIPSAAKIRPGLIPPKKTCIVIHNTGNYNPGCDAEWHDRYIHAQAASATPREASWHLSVDDKGIFEHIPLWESAWHAGDTGMGRGNYTGIGIEICVNGFPETYEGEEFEKWLVVFRKAMHNAAVLTKYLMIKYEIPMSGILQHYDCAPEKKNCPQQMRRDLVNGGFSRENGTLYNEFVKEVGELRL